MYAAVSISISNIKKSRCLNSLFADLLYMTLILYNTGCLRANRTVLQKQYRPSYHSCWIPQVCTCGIQRE